MAVTQNCRLLNIGAGFIALIVGWLNIEGGCRVLGLERGVVVTLRHHGGLDAVLVEAAGERGGLEVGGPGGGGGGETRALLRAGCGLVVFGHGQLGQAGRAGEAGNLRDDGEFSLWRDGRAK